MRILRAMALGGALLGLMLPYSSEAVAKKPRKQQKAKQNKAAAKSSKADAAVSIEGVKANATRAAVARVADDSDTSELRLEGRITRKKGRLTLLLTAFDENGKKRGQKRFRGKNDRVLARTVKRELGDFLSSLAPDQQPTETQADSKTTAKADEADKDDEADAPDKADDKPLEPAASTSDSLLLKRDAPGAATWSLAAGPELIGRSFSYRDDVFAELREYSLRGAFAVSMQADYYPLSQFGVAAAVSLSPSFTTDGPFEEEYQSRTSGLRAGARYRRPLASGLITAALDYGQRSFSVGSSGESMSSGIPDVDYKFVRLATGASWPLTERFAVQGSLGYRLLLATGQIESEEYFPRSSAHGMDAELSLSAKVSGGFTVLVGTALERYGFALKPEPGDPNVAGGAVDQYLRYFVSVGYGM